MSSQTVSIINSATQKKDKYNILTFDTHERYQCQQAKTGHNFFSFRYDGCKEWDTNYSEIPENYYIMPTDHFAKKVKHLLNRYRQKAVNCSFLSKQVNDNTDTDSLDKYETLSNLLTEIAESKK